MTLIYWRNIKNLIVIFRYHSYTVVLLFINGEYIIITMANLVIDTIDIYKNLINQKLL